VDSFFSEKIKIYILKLLYEYNGKFNDTHRVISNILLVFFYEFTLKYIYIYIYIYISIYIYIYIYIYIDTHAQRGKSKKM
jgi:hypothetical protein